MVIIMCGGAYKDFKKHKALSKVRGEILVERTIRLLEKHGVEWFISTNDANFDKYGHILHHQNNFEVKDGKVKGYWVDAFYPTSEPCIYLHGDVWYSDDAMDKILSYKARENTLIGNAVAKNEAHEDMGEPFGWIIPNQKAFRYAIEQTKRLQDNGQLKRGYAISWELYRVMNGTDPNYMLINDENYLCIDDNTIDVDTPEQIKEVDDGKR